MVNTYMYIQHIPDDWATKGNNELHDCLNTEPNSQLHVLKENREHK